MKISINKTDLVQAIDAVIKAVKKKSTAPILEGILIDTTYNGIKLTGTDTETSIQYKVDCNVEEPGQIVLNAALFSEIVKKMTNNIRITVNSNFEAAIQSGETNITIKGLDSKGFPSIPEINANASFEIDQKEFREMVSRISFAIAYDVARPMLAGIHIDVQNGQINMAATNGFYMAIRKNSVSSNINKQVLLDAKTLDTISKAFENGSMTVNIAENQVQFRSENIMASMGTLSWTYIDYKNFIPKDNTTELKINTKQFLNSISKAILLITETDKKCSPIILNIKDDNLNLSLSTSLGEFSDDINVDVSGDNLRITFNPTYLIEILRRIEDEDINIKFNGEFGPILIVPTEGDKFLYFVLPVRVPK